MEDWAKSLKSRSSEQPMDLIIPLGHSKTIRDKRQCNERGRETIIIESALLPIKIRVQTKEWFSAHEGLGRFSAIQAFPRGQPMCHCIFIKSLKNHSLKGGE